jgi:hypothetical protein
MTLFQIEELTSYWAQHPPPHLLIAAYLGVGRNKHGRLPSMSTGRGQRMSSDSSSWLAQLGPGFCTGDVDAGLSPVILDFAELRLQAGIPD